MSNDPVTAAPLFEDAPEDELHTDAVKAISQVLARHWPGVTEETLQRSADAALRVAVTVGPQDATVLVSGHPDHCFRLAHAVRSTAPTGPCPVCGHAPYNGAPTQQDLVAAEQVINALVVGLGPW